MPRGGRDGGSVKTDRAAKQDTTVHNCISLESVKPLDIVNLGPFSSFSLGQQNHFFFFFFFKATT